MGDASARVGGRKRGAAPSPPAPPQPKAERASRAEHETTCDTEVALLRATNAALAEELAAVRGARDAAVADADRVMAAFRALGGTRSNLTSDASPTLFLAVLARLGENGYAREAVRCVNVCKDARSNVQLWERIVDLPHADKTAPAWHGTAYRPTRLMHWAEAGDVARVRATLGRGADIDVRDSMGHTSLYWASCGGHVAVVRELLDRGADANARSINGGTALHIASNADRTAVVRELAARGADVNATDNAFDTPLMVACSHGRSATVAALLLVGADVNPRDGNGWTALMQAALQGHADVVRVLLAAPGVDVGLADAYGYSALQWARDWGHADIVAQLEAAGAR